MIATKSNLLAAAVAASLLCAVPTAQAQDFGIGAGVTLGGGLAFVGGPMGGLALPLPGPLAGVEATYWLDDALALDFYGTLGVIVPDGGDARFDLGFGAGILYALAQGDDTKLELGVRAGIIAVINAAFGFGDDEDADLFLDTLLRVEHWFDDHFAINGQVGLNFRGDPDGNPGFGMLLGANAGLGMMFYTDGVARPGDGNMVETEPAPEPPPRAEPPPPRPAPPPPAEEPPPDPESGAAGW